MDGPYTKTAAWGPFCRDVAQWNLTGHGALMINKQACGQCLGQVGISHGPLFPEYELGWLLFPDAEGYGYAVACRLGARLDKQMIGPANDDLVYRHF